MCVLAGGLCHSGSCDGAKCQRKGKSRFRLPGNATHNSFAIEKALTFDAADMLSISFLRTNDKK